MNPFRLLVLAFRAAVRTEVDRAMADRRRALSVGIEPISPEEAARIARYLSSHGVEMRGPAEILPFPIANDRHEPSPPSAA